jgi:uridine kinase
VFIDCDDDVRLSRRVLKNERKEGANKQSLSELLKTYEDKTKPAFEKFIEPSKKYANTIIPNYGFSTEQLELDKMSVPAVDLIISFIET